MKRYQQLYQMHINKAFADVYRTETRLDLWLKQSSINRAVYLLLLKRHFNPRQVRRAYSHVQ